MFIFIMVVGVYRARPFRSNLYAGNQVRQSRFVHAESDAAVFRIGA